VPYRQRVRASEADESGPLLRLDTSGASGHRARDGTSGMPGSGTNGEHASPAGAGAPGGAIDLRLRSEPSDSWLFTVEGAGVRSDGVRQSIQRAIRIRDEGALELLSPGGRGGDGGRGGAGGSGWRGSAGSDATRYSRGGDGGPGGPGGDGGNGSSGGDGGRGGNVIVRVDERDTHLLMLVEPNVRGGHGGTRGDNGSGGAGGPGGPGGSSYSWTETESTTDAQGNRQTRSVSHTNSGGSDGPSGRSGNPGSAPLSSGRTGLDGAYTIVVESGSQAGSYPSRYELRLLDLQLENENQDGIFEPGERVIIHDLLVRNVGGMPTPANHPISIEVAGSGWVEARDAVIRLPRPLAPGEKFRFSGATLDFDLAGWDPRAPGEALAERDTVQLRAALPSARRAFAAFQSTLPPDKALIPIRFPLEASALESLHSLAADRAAKLRFRVKNASSKALGRDSETGRAIVCRLAFDRSEIGDRDLVFFDDAGRRIRLSDGWEREIARLEPGADTQIETTIGVSEAAEAYRSARLLFTLELGGLDAPDRPRPIQFRDFELRVARPYRESDAELLLVVNNRTTREELDAWDELASELGIRTNVFDLSLEGRLDFARIRASTIVLLNHAFDTASGELLPSDLVDKHALLAAAGSGAHLLFVGDRPPLESWLVPSAPADADDPDELAVTEGAAIQVEERYWLWGRPTPERLERRGRTLVDVLLDRHPLRRYVVTHGFEPDVSAARFALVKRCVAGRLRAYRTLDRARGALVAVAADEPAVHSPEFVRSETCATGLLLASSFDKKLERLGALCRRSKQRDRLNDVACDAVLVDLANEQAAALHDGWTLAAPRRLMAHLPLLGELAGAASRLQTGSRLGAALLLILAEVVFLAKRRVAWWEWIVPLFWLRRATKLWLATRALASDALERAFGDDPLELVTARRKLADNQKRLSEELGRAKQQFELLAESPREHCLARLRAPIAGASIDTDAELLLDGDLLLIEAERHDRLVKHDAKVARRIERHAGKAERARRELLVPESTTELLAAERSTSADLPARSST
jgi:hypothetical protein